MTRCALRTRPRPGSSALIANLVESRRNKNGIVMVTTRSSQKWLIRSKRLLSSISNSTEILCRPKVRLCRSAATLKASCKGRALSLWTKIKILWHLCLSWTNFRTETPQMDLAWKVKSTNPTRKRKTRDRSQCKSMTTTRAPTTWGFTSQSRPNQWRGLCCTRKVRSVTPPSHWLSYTVVSKRKASRISLRTILASIRSGTRWEVSRESVWSKSTTWLRILNLQCLSKTNNWI